MYLSFAVLFAGLAAAALLASRRDRLFLAVAALGAVGLIDGFVWGVGPLGGVSIGLAMLIGATILTVGEAVGLPGPVARITRLGIRNRERDFDWRLWKLVAPLWSSLQEGALAEGAPRPGSREHLLRSARRLVERLTVLRPPNADWGSVRDGYVTAVSGELRQLVNGASETAQLLAFREATATTLATIAQLRGRYRPDAPPAPPWAAIVLFAVLPIVRANVLDLYDRAAETIVPPAVAVGWQQMRVPFPMGDGWGGDAVTDGKRMFLVSRESIDGFWGVIKVRSSSDGGLSWTAPGAASLTEVPETARPAIALAPDGSIWVAMVRQGPQVATQILQIGRSTDEGITWPVLARASPPSVGLVGLPVLLVTADVHVVAYTNGATGAAMIQPLTVDSEPQGQPDGAPVVLGTTTRQLYSDAEFLDAGFALAAAGRHVVALWHPSDGIINVSISDDAGHTWRSAPSLATHSAWDRPHLLVVHGRFVALDVRAAGNDVRRWLQLDTSSDGGETWTSGAPLSNGLVGLEGALEVSGGTWQLIYSACPGEIGCITAPRIWYRSSRDGEHWSDPQALSPPRSSMGVIGVGTSNGQTWAIWERDPDTLAEHRVVEGVVRPAGAP